MSIYSLDWIEQRAQACPGHDHHPLQIDPIRIEAGAIQHIPAYLAEHGFKRVVIVADKNTYEAAGEYVSNVLEQHSVPYSLSFAQPNEQGDVVADERTLVQVMLNIPRESTDMVIAVGAGTVHDITRMIVYKMGLPFLSVPTAPSVDGFTSRGAPIIVNGMKKTFAACGPAAIFADLDVLVRSPREMVAAGFGDMLAKYTSLFDWTYSHMVGGEPYCETAASITRKALDDCVRHADAIACRDHEGIRVLLTALVESGLAMLLFGHSHPASGAEHHLSHYWEMEYLRLGKRQLLHGAKVGVTTTLISELYRQHAGDAHFPEEVRKAAANIPEPEQLRTWLRLTGGPATTEELGIDASLVERSLKEAHTLRDRKTMLRTLNEREQGKIGL